VRDRIDLNLVPDSPGVYVFRDSEGKPLYVGKAKSLRSRLASYFHGPAGGDSKTVSMLEEADSVDWTVASSDSEAILLEYNLIQEHHPRFNIRLRDDKSFPYLVVSMSEEWPRAFIGRGKPKKGYKYLGPFARAHAIRETLDLLRKAFPIRTCSNVQFKEHRMLNRPCLYYDIQLCAGPCVDAVSQEEYRALVSGFCKAIAGRHRRIAGELEALMWQAAENEEYERAALYRNRLEALQKVAERQQVLSAKSPSFDMVGIARDELQGRIEVFRVRHGALRGRHGYFVDLERNLSDEDLVYEVLTELYGGSLRLSDESSVSIGSDVAGAPAKSDALDGDVVRGDGIRVPGEVPPEIIVPVLPTDRKSLEEFLAAVSGSPVAVKIPRGKDRRQLMNLVIENAAESLQRVKMKRASDHNARSRALLELQEALGLPEAPFRIECFDISNMGPTEVVGSMVVFEDAMPKSSAYRKFKVKGIEGQDDYASMREVVSRRLGRLEDDRARSSSKYKPGLLLIDGGPGQLSAALEALGEHGRQDIPVAALAKRFEEVFVPGRSDPVVLRRDSEALFLLQRIRDEAHRFAISYHRNRREKGATRSVLEDIPGLGPKRVRQVLSTFGSIDALRDARPEEIARRASIPKNVAEKLSTFLESEEKTRRGATGGRSS
jgi:excinuclease ABC subunit C